MRIPLSTATVAMLGAGLSPLAVAATEYGAVVSRTPACAQVAVPQRQCIDQPVTVLPPATGGGALLGALVGGYGGGHRRWR